MKELLVVVVVVWRRRRQEGRELLLSSLWSSFPLCSFLFSSLSLSQLCRSIIKRVFFSVYNCSAVEEWWWWRRQMESTPFHSPHPSIRMYLLYVCMHYNSYGFKQKEREERQQKSIIVTTSSSILFFYIFQELSHSKDDMMMVVR